MLKQKKRHVPSQHQYFQSFERKKLQSLCIIPSTGKKKIPHFLLLYLLRALRHLRRWLQLLWVWVPVDNPLLQRYLMALVSLFCCTSFPYRTCLCLCGEEFIHPQKAQWVYSVRYRKMSSLQTPVLLEVEFPAEGKCDFIAFWSQYH